MMPRLTAEEMLETSNAVALGSGSLKRGDRQRLMRELIARAGGRRAPPADPLALAMMGIAVEVVPPAGRDGEASHG